MASSRRLFTVTQHLSAQNTFATAATPFVPEPLLPGGRVLTLFAPDSTLLNAERVHEAETYNHRGQPADLAATAAGRTRTVVNVHNPTIEAHILPPGPQNTGSAIIVVPGGGHRILMIGPEGGDCVPFFANYGISTIILRERLRIDGCVRVRVRVRVRVYLRVHSIAVPHVVSWVGHTPALLYGHQEVGALGVMACCGCLY